MESALDAAGGVVPFQAQAHHAETDGAVCQEPLWQTVVDRGDGDVLLEHLEAPLDVGQRLVAGDDRLGVEVSHAGEQHQRAVEDLGLGEGGLVDAEREALGLEVGLDEARELCLDEGLMDAEGGEVVEDHRPLGVAQRPQRPSPRPGRAGQSGGGSSCRQRPGRTRPDADRCGSRSRGRG